MVPRYFYLRGTFIAEPRVRYARKYLPGITLSLKTKLSCIKISDPNFKHSFISDLQFKSVHVRNEESNILAIIVALMFQISLTLILK